MTLIRLTLGAFVLVVAFAQHALAQDCNNNSIADSIDISGTGFSPSFMSGAPQVPPFVTAALVDYNLDGKKDIVQVHSENSVVTAALIPQDGQQFSTAAAQTITLPLTPIAIGIGDFDTNGFADIGFATTGAQANAFNQGNDSFTVLGGQAVTGLAPINFPGGEGTQQNADLNGDGFIDRIVVNGITVEIYLRDAMNTLTLDDTVTPTFTQCNFSATGTVEILPPTDLDGDGDIDPAIITNHMCSFPTGDVRRSRVIFLDNDGSANFTEATLADDNGTIDFLEYNDVNADGTQELVFSTLRASISGLPASQPRITRSGIFVYRVIRNSTSKDRNGNTIPDECERAVPGDFGGDRRSDNAVVRPLGGNLLWLVRHSSERPLIEPTQQFFGLTDFDLPYAGDFDGSGTVEPAVVRDAGSVIPSLFGLWWYNRLEDGTANAVQWGLSGDIPVAGHFDTDRIADRAAVRNLSGQLTWFVRRSTHPSFTGLPWGLPGDTAFAANIFGDGEDELIVTRNFLGGVYWFIRDLSGVNKEQHLWGLAGIDTPLAPLDADGDGFADLAVARRRGRFLDFYIRLSTGGSRVSSVGLVGDVPYLGYFGDENSLEPSVFRPAPNVFLAEAYHYQRTASNLIRVRNWGFFGDYLVRPDGRGVR